MLLCMGTLPPSTSQLRLLSQLAAAAERPGSSAVIPRIHEGDDFRAAAVGSYKA